MEEIEIFLLKTNYLRKKISNSECFWSVFYRIWTEYRDLVYISLHSIQIRENTNQKTPIMNTFYAVINN